MEKGLSFKSISIELTKRCNLECTYCYARSNKSEEKSELKTSDLKRFLKVFKENGGNRVLFTGGEALLREDFQELVSFAREIGLVVDLFTNGLLIDEKNAKYISENINLVNMSLDGPKEHHDKVRQRKGSFDRSVQGLQFLNYYHAHYAIQSMITNTNYGEYNWLIELVKEFNPVMVKLGHVSKMGRGINCTNLWLEKEKILYLKKMASKISEVTHFHTRVITNVITKDEFEKFYPSLDAVSNPWLLPDGRIISCYVNKGINNWVISDVWKYPVYDENTFKRTSKLMTEVYREALSKEYIDMLELTSQVAERYI